MLLVRKGQQAQLDQLVHRELPVHREQLVHKEFKVQLEQLDHKVVKEIKDQLVTLGQPVQQVQPAR